MFYSDKGTSIFLPFEKFFTSSTEESEDRSRLFINSPAGMFECTMSSLSGLTILVLDYVTSSCEGKPASSKQVPFGLHSLYCSLGDLILAEC